MIPFPEMSEDDYTREIAKMILTDRKMVADNPIMFCMAGMSEEIGEAAAVKKLLRGDYPESDFVKGGPRHEALVKELGDGMWYLYNLMRLIGVTPGEVRNRNYIKCVDRHARGVVRGDGDDR